jgi:ABC-type Fe3+/spermidine/putrescine transport system ATPase subunit
MVFQNYALFPHMTVEQNLWFGLSMHHIPRGEARRRIANILELLGLTGLSLRYPRQLSGGEQQRVAVGRVLVLRPRVLLFDEPLSNLDAKLRKETRYEIRRLQREIATTAVYVTHDQEEAMAIADRIGVMKDGQIEQEGQPAQVYEQPRTRFIADFIGTSNFLQATAVWVNGNRAMFRTLEGLDVLVELQDGQEPLLAGSERTIAIRAEKLSLSPVRREAIVPLGRVLSAVKLGPITEVRIALLGGRQLLVHVTKQDAASINEPGQEVELSWPPDGWFVLSE